MKIRLAILVFTIMLKLLLKIELQCIGQATTEQMIQSAKETANVATQSQSVQQSARQEQEQSAAGFLQQVISSLCLSSPFFTCDILKVN